MLGDTVGLGQAVSDAQGQLETAPFDDNSKSVFCVKLEITRRDVRGGRCMIVPSLCTKDFALNDHGDSFLPRIEYRNSLDASLWPLLSTSMSWVQLSGSHFVNIQQTPSR